MATLPDMLFAIDYAALRFRCYFFAYFAAIRYCCFRLRIDYAAAWCVFAGFHAAMPLRRLIFDASSIYLPRCYVFAPRYATNIRCRHAMIRCLLRHAADAFFLAIAALKIVLYAAAFLLMPLPPLQRCSRHLR